MEPLVAKDFPANRIEFRIHFFGVDVPTKRALALGGDTDPMLTMDVSCRPRTCGVASGVSVWLVSILLCVMIVLVTVPGPQAARSH